jgi:galactose mutarotase-like enzyme
MTSLENDHLALTMRTDFGARITTLTDRATQRQWLVPGDCIAGDTYLGDQARGWDECFPTVAPCDHTAWGGRLRDHGLLWGRPWRASGDGEMCTAVCHDARFTFSRTLRLTGPNLTADYCATNLSDSPLPYLWSQHALLSTTPADRIVLRGVGSMTAGGQPIAWPSHPQRDLSTIGTLDERFALKAYAQSADTAAAEIAGPDGGIRFEWSGAQVSAFGLWLDYGGWPRCNPVHQVALEPTTAPANDLAQAEHIGCARLLAPGESHSWSVRISMTPGIGGAANA